jgi:hypothetical protein
MPQTVTHEKVLVDCDTEFRQFIESMDILGEKLGPQVLQFPYFDRWKFRKQEDFLAVLRPFLEKLPADHKFAIEIRTKLGSILFLPIFCASTKSRLFFRIPRSCRAPGNSRKTLIL